MTEEKNTSNNTGDKFSGARRKIAILSVIIVAVLVGYGIYAKKINLGTLKGASVKNITADDAKAKVEKIISDNGGGATVKSVADAGSLYKVALDVNGQEQDVYVTKDGAQFIPQAISFEDLAKQAADAKQKQEDAAKPVPKSDTPIVDLYVMGFCPYGNKAEDTLKPVYNLLKNKVTFNFHYIVTADGDSITSLHGPAEVTEDEREACILKNYGKDFWINFATYVNANCGSDGSCWEKGAQSLGIDTSKISACVSAEGVTLMKAEADASNAAGASGSPTMIINGQSTQAVYQYGNSEAYKKAICDAFNTAPSECSKALSSQTSTTQGGSCGS